MKNKAVGYISLVFGVLILLLEILIFSSIIPPFGNPVTTNLMVIGFLYAAYKTLYKKEELSESEWIVMGFLFIIFLLPLFLAF